MRESRRWWGLGLLAVLAFVGQLYGLYRVTGPPVPPWFRQADKGEHALGFALPTALVLTALDARERLQHRLGLLSSRRVVVVAGLFAAHGVVSELVQHFCYLSRTGDPFDVAADWAGTAVGVGAALLVRRLAPAGARVS